jgi:hypothetical protein
MKPTRAGEEPVPLTNFIAAIVADILECDGVEARRQYELLATVDGTPRRFRVPAKEFPTLAWVAEHLGARAIVNPGRVVKDQVPVAIQATSAHLVERRVFTHTGWHQGQDGHWYYFHGGGILGAGGHLPQIEVALPASLRLLDVAPRTVTVPLWLAAWRAALGRMDFGLHLEGASGVGKSELTALVQQHYGAGFARTHLPGAWFSTENALELLAFLAKDMPLVIDDFCPKGKGR